MTGIAILTIATGAYLEDYFDDLRESIQRNFCIGHHVEIFCFTDRPREFEGPGTTYIACSRLGWPFDTLLRFHRFDQIEAELQQFDLVVYMDADLRVDSQVAISDISHELFAVQHPGFEVPTRLRALLPQRKLASFEINPDSKAYVSATRRPYVQGCLFGGASKSMREMISTLASWTADDLSLGEVPIYHDESYLNRYLSERSYHLLPPSYAYPEGSDLPFAQRITHRQKAHSLVRGESTLPISVERILNRDTILMSDLYRRMYLRAHEKNQVLEGRVRALQHAPTALAWHLKRLLTRRNVGSGKWRG